MTVDLSARGIREHRSSAYAYVRQHEPVTRSPPGQKNGW